MFVKEIIALKKGQQQTLPLSIQQIIVSSKGLTDLRYMADITDRRWFIF